MTTQQDESGTSAVGGPWDGVIMELRTMRRSTGEPSYRTIASRVAEQRVATGMSEHAARIATSSVHDAFRLGRTRINLPLVRELVAALGGDVGLVESWVREAAMPAAPPVPPSPAPIVVEVPRDLPAPDESRAAASRVVLLLVACVALNLVDRLVVDELHLPIYLDMVGTAIAAVALGPWRGAAVGATTNVLGIATSGLVSLPFAAVNVVGALVWGYGVHTGRLGRTLPRYLALTLGVGVACSAVAVPILLALPGHLPRDGHSLMPRVLEQRLPGYVLAIAAANLLTSLADKLISGFVALVAVSALPRNLRPSAVVPIAEAGPAGPAAVRPIRFESGDTGP